MPYKVRLICNAGGFKVRHCCRFNADDIYYLKDTDLFTSRTLSIGFCPICKKPVAELVEYGINGSVNKISLAGLNANNLVLGLKNEILYSIRDLNYRKLKSKPFGWKYGVNIETKDGKVKQYAYDFYGNKELIKIT